MLMTPGTGAEQQVVHRTTHEGGHEGHQQFHPPLHESQVELLRYDDECIRRRRRRRRDFTNDN